MEIYIWRDITFNSDMIKRRKSNSCPKFIYKSSTVTTQIPAGKHIAPYKTPAKTSIKS